MPAKRAKSLFSQFLSAAVAERKFISSTLHLHNAQLIPRLEQLIGNSSRDGCFDELTEQQSNQCLDEIINSEAVVSGEMSPFMLNQHYEISKWRIDGQDVPTSSRVMIYYGRLPCLSTLFQFETVEQFRHVKRILEDLGLCKLNEKHLKTLRTKKKYLRS
jgi:hypothetical protein